MSMERKVYKQSGQWLIRELGTGRDVAIVPSGGVFESLKSSEQIAKEIQLLPDLLAYVRSQAFHGSSEAARLLEELER